MLFVEKGVDKVIGVRLKEVSTLFDPFFFLTLTKEGSGEKIIIGRLPDFSLIPNRINIFRITGESTESLQKGQYLFEFYESEEPAAEIEQTTGTPILTGRLVIKTEAEENKDNLPRPNSIYD